jgi:hypothetical protein
MGTGQVDLTGYDTVNGFDDSRATIVNTFRVEWPETIPTDSFVNASFFNEIWADGTTHFLNCSLRLINNNSQVQIEIPANQFNTTLTLGQVRNRWLTLVASLAPSPSDFENWTGTGVFGTVYMRVCLFDTVTGELVFRSDRRGFAGLPLVSAMSDIIATGQSESDFIFSGGFGSGSSETTLYEFRWSNHWISVGTMFDPLGAAGRADTSWRTTRPSAVIGNARAWLNIQTANFELTESPDIYYVTASGQDLYTEPNNRHVRNGGYTDSEWTTAYSDTIITTDQG